MDDRTIIPLVGVVSPATGLGDLTASLVDFKAPELPLKLALLSAKHHLLELGKL